MPMNRTKEVFDTILAHCNFQDESSVRIHNIVKERVEAFLDNNSFEEKVPPRSLKVSLVSKKKVNQDGNYVVEQGDTTFVFTPSMKNGVLSVCGDKNGIIKTRYYCPHLIGLKKFFIKVTRLEESKFFYCDTDCLTQEVFFFDNEWFGFGRSCDLYSLSSDSYVQTEGDKILPGNCVILIDDKLHSFHEDHYFIYSLSRCK
jgi:hypothetical protein